MNNFNFNENISCKNDPCNKSCTPSFFKQNSCTCSPKAKWKGPGGGPLSFYTTWSFYAIFAIIFITFIGGGLLSFTKLSKSNVASYIILALIIGFAANSIAVGITSQILVDYNWKPLSGKDTDKTAISESWVKKFNLLNLKVHLLPVLISIIILICIVKIPWTGSKHWLYIISCIVPILFFFIWACIPIPVSEGSNTKSTPFNKASIVYNNPSIPIELTLPISIFIIIALFVFAAKK